MLKNLNNIKMPQDLNAVKCPFCSKIMKALDFSYESGYDIDNIYTCRYCESNWAKKGDPSVEFSILEEDGDRLLYSMNLRVKDIKIAFYLDEGEYSTQFWLYDETAPYYWRRFLSFDEDIEFDLDDPEFMKKISLYLTFG